MKIEKGSIKSATTMKVMKYILWVFIGFIFLKGVVSVFKPNPAANLEKLLVDYKSSSSQQERFVSEGSSFAEMFARDYMTYKPNNTDEYSQRLDKYLPNYLSNMSGSITSQVNVQALDAKTVTTKIVSDTEINVDVRVSVQYGTSAVRNVYLRVPVISDSGKYAVEDVPQLIPGPDAANVQMKSITAQSIDNDKEPGIKDMLNNFLKTYCEGNQTELMYYFTTNQTAQIKGLQGLFKFKRINEFEMYKWPDETNFLAVVNFTVFDPLSNQDIQQAIHLFMVKKDSKYYIKSFDVRTGNLQSDSNNGGEQKK